MVVDVIMIVNDKGIIKMVNFVVEYIYGYKFDEFIGFYVFEIVFYERCYFYDDDFFS